MCHPSCGENDILPYEGLNPFDLRQVCVHVSPDSNIYSSWRDPKEANAHLYIIGVCQRVSTAQHDDCEADVVDGM